MEYFEVIIKRAGSNNRAGCFAIYKILRVVFNDLFTPHILVINEFKIEMVSRLMQNKLWGAN